MSIVITMHQIFGEMILPILIVIAAILMTVMHKPNTTYGPTKYLFPLLVDLQVGLGVIYWLFFLSIPMLAPRYLGLPFILHPILGLIAAILAHMAVSSKNPLQVLGRWAPMASLAVLLIIVLSNILLANAIA